MADPIRVLYLNHATELGGAEFALARLLEATDLARVRPLVLFAGEGPAVDLLRETHAEVHVLPLSEEIRTVNREQLGSARALHPKRILGVLRYAGSVARFARQHRAALIHTNSIKAHLYGGIAGRLAGVPTVWHIRDFVHASYLPAPAVWSIRALARILPSHVIAVSHSVLEQMHLPAGSGTAVHDGLPDREIRPYRDPAWPERGEPVRFGIVGGLRPWKGQHIFLRAAADVLERGHAVRFQIIGGPLFGYEEYETELRAYVAAHGLEPYVDFLGFRRDVPELLARLDVLVHASTSADPCPNVVLEGMAAGLPVIGSSGGGVPEMIEAGRTGLLTPMGDPAALADAMEQLITNPAAATRMGRAGYRRLTAQFTSHRTARGVEAVYRTLLGDALPPSERAAKEAPAPDLVALPPSQA